MACTRVVARLLIRVYFKLMQNVYSKSDVLINFNLFSIYVKISTRTLKSLNFLLNMWAKDDSNMLYNEIVLTILKYSV